MDKASKPTLRVALAAIVCAVSLVLVALFSSTAWADSGVYAFVCQDDSSTQTLVIKHGADEPTAYGAVLSDWHEETSKHKTIDLTDTTDTYANGGIASGNYAYQQGVGANSWPWRTDTTWNATIKKVVVEGDGIQINLYYTFDSLTAVEEFDLTGLDTSAYNRGANSTNYYEPYNYSVWYTFGQTVAKRSSAVKKIITGEKWTLPMFPGLQNPSASAVSLTTPPDTATTFWFTARTNVVESRTPWWKYGSQYAGKTRLYWNYIYTDGKVHSYYTDEATAKANQEADYKAAYGDADPSQYTGSWRFATQPVGQSGYTSTSLENINVANKNYFNELTAGAVVTGADGLEPSGGGTFTWYRATKADGSDAVAITTDNVNEYGLSFPSNGKLGFTSRSGFYNHGIANAGAVYYYCEVTGGGVLGRSNTVKVTAIDKADTPTIVTQPSGTDADFPVEYVQGKKATTLSITQTGEAAYKTKYDLSTTPTVTYQWYRSYEDGDYEAIEDATSASYTPNTRIAAGNYRYYCVVTYTATTATDSMLPTVQTSTQSETSYMKIVNLDLAPGTPTFTDIQMEDATYESSFDTYETLEASVDVPEGDKGSLSYQWFVATSAESDPAKDEAVTEVAEVPEDGVVSYTPTFTGNVDNYYYCVVTNNVPGAQNENVSGTSKAVKISMPSEIHVADTNQFIAVANNPSKYNDKTIVLDADVDVSAVAAWPEVSFSNTTIDGQGHTISGVSNFHLSAANLFYVDDASRGSLFSKLTNCTVKNLTVEGQTGLAGVAGAAISTTFENVVSRVNVSLSTDEGYLSCGGIVGYGYNVVLKNCGNEGTIQGALSQSGWHEALAVCSAGGIAGTLIGKTEISGCYNTGAVSARGAAGIVARVFPEYCSDFGKPSVDPFSMGGLGGAETKFEQGAISISNCYNTGTIKTIRSNPGSGTENGLSGTGGILGTFTLSAGQSIDNSSVSYEKVTVSNCYNAGKLEFNTDPGESDIAWTYDAVAAKPGNGTAATVTNCYYLEGNSWTETETAATKTAAELASDSTVAALNGEGGTAWKAGVLYPILSWQNDDVSAAVPVITDQDTKEFTTVRNTAYAPIEISASIDNVKDAYKGTLTYQWYSNTEASTEGGTAIEGATSNSFTPLCDTLGTAYYYCVATNTFSSGALSATSALYTCVTTSDLDAETPKFTTQPKSAEYAYGTAPEPLSVAVDESGEAVGTITYQWYQMKGDEPASNDTKISNATEATYTPAATVGTTKYYCVVTNTFEGTKVATATSDVASVTVGNTVTIANTADFKAFADSVNNNNFTYSGVTVTLAADLDLAADAATRTWQPIGYSSKAKFQGTFDGGNHTISGLNVQASAIANDANYCALFGYIDSATIKDLIVEGASDGNSKAQYVGGVCAAANYSYTITNVHSNVEVSGATYAAGGILAQNVLYKGTISQCSNWGNVSGAATAHHEGIGGILGAVGQDPSNANRTVTVKDCYNRGTVIGLLDTENKNWVGAGGIVGQVYGATIVQNCYNAGAVSATGMYANHASAVAGYLTGYAWSLSLFKAENNYYLQGTAEAGIQGEDGATFTQPEVKTEDEMKAADFVSALNASREEAVWKQGSTYPVFVAQTSEPAGEVLVITTQPKSAAYELNAAEVTDLSVGVAGASNPSYQWYSNTTESTEGAKAIEEATKATYTPAVDVAGTTYYFCKVTAGSAEATSGIAAVEVASATPAATPTITVQPVSAHYFKGTTEVTPLTVEATVTGEGAGVLSYQWYKMEGTEPNAEADTAIEGATEATYTPSADFEASYYCVVTNTFEQLKTATATSGTASITLENEIVTISSLEEMAAFRDAVNAGNDYFGKTVKLEPGTYNLADSAVTSIWQPIGVKTSRSGSDNPFKGEFDGQGSTIIVSSLSTSIYPDSTSQIPVGVLFGTIDGGAVRNVNVEGQVDTWTSAGYGAMVVGVIANGTIENVSVSGTLGEFSAPTGNYKYPNAYRTGGIASQATSTTISNVSANLTMYGWRYVGGIVEKATDCTISNARFEGAITLDPAMVGNSWNAYSSYAGGIVCELNGGSVANALSSANISVGYNPSANGSERYAGGIAAKVAKSDLGAATITCSKHEGTVDGAQFVGGLAGSVDGGSTISSCYDTAAIGITSTATSSLVGGLVGNLASGSKLVDCYHTGQIDGTATTGGLVGSGVASDVLNCAYSWRAYPDDPTGIEAMKDEAMQTEEFATTLNEEGKTTNFVYVPGKTPQLFWEKPFYLADSGVSVAESVEYTGSALTPEVTVTYTAADGTVSTLAEGTDFTVEYANNVEAGTATVTVTGTGDYAGTITKEFTIVKSDAKWSRLAGDDRYKTMASIVGTGFESADTVFVASGEGFADALPATALAGAYDAPVILTAKNALSEEAAAEIERLGAKNVVIVGGEGAVSAGVYEDLFNKGYNVERLYGDSRIATSLAIYNAGTEIDAWGDTAIVTTGWNYADALSISPYAYAKGAPIFLAQDGMLSEETVKAIQEGGFTRVLFIGGTGVVSDEVATQLGNTMKYTRIAGDTRLQTSAKVASFCLSEGMQVNGMAVAYANNFPDALAGGALCGSTNSILMLAADGADDYVSPVVMLNANTLAQAYVLGGTGVISDSLMNQFINASK